MYSIKNSSLCLALLSIISISYGQSEIDRDKLRSLSTEIQEIVKATKAVGVSVALIHNYEVVWAEGFGVTESGTYDSVKTETLFQVASITKPVTALAVMKKVQDGSISLNGDVNAQLTSWKIPDSPFTAVKPVTVKGLLSHTAGVASSRYLSAGFHEGDVLPTIIQSLRGDSPARNAPVQMMNTPGVSFTYSNCGYWILEALLEDVTKTKFADVVSAEVLAPLGMEHSTFQIDFLNENFKRIAAGHVEKNKVIDGRYYVVLPLSSGGLWSTATDIARVLIEMQLSLKGRSNKILNEENAKLMVTPVIGNYGLGFTNEIRGTGVKFFGHDGHNIGYISSMIGSLDNGFGVVILTNSENGWKAVNKIKKLVGRKFWGF